MEAPVTDTVFFYVTVHATERDGHWVARTLETTVHAYGETREEAEAAAGEGNALLVAEMKRHGMAALREYLTRNGIPYSVGQPLALSPAERLERAA
jgi:predicted RNase H-like HicB family nuclease